MISHYTFVPFRIVRQKKMACAVDPVDSFSELLVLHSKQPTLS